MVYRDAEWHERVTARVKSIIESLDPQNQLQNREMDVLAFSGADCCWDERVYRIIGKLHNENEGASCNRKGYPMVHCINGKLYAKKKSRS